MRAYFVAALIALAASIVPGAANAADEIAPLMKRIATAADNVLKAAHKPHAKVSDVASKVELLVAIMVPLVAIAEREPNEVAAHSGTIKRLGQDMSNISGIAGLAIGMEDDDDNATVTIEQIAALAESIRDSARAY